MDDINSEHWLLGAYVYNAVLATSPIFNPFAKKGTKPLPYLDKPFESKEKGKIAESKAEKIPAHIRAEQERIRAYMYLNAWAKATNNQRKK
jgi:hypothetical protein